MDSNRLLAHPSGITDAAEYQRSLNALHSAQMDEVSRLQLEREKARMQMQQLVDTRCPLMPAQTHCFHEQLRLWDDPFPNAMVCCWCGVESQEITALPFRHGPSVPDE